MNKLTTIILTKDSESSISKVINSCRSISSRILIIDDFSTDKTVKIAKSLGCEIIKHKFENYSKQRNWAQKYTNLNQEDWILHLDSDEVLSKKLANIIKKAIDKKEADGYLIKKRIYFMEKPIRFGHMNPNWHLRLFKAGKGFCEYRLYDQHFVSKGKTKKLNGLLLDLQLTTLEKWTSSHNKWSTAEALEILLHKNRNNQQLLPENFFGDKRMQKRWLKNNIYYRSPVLLRSILFFLYSYFFRFGFLDGKIGFIYHILQAFWFRFLIDAKIIELKKK